MKARLITIGESEIRQRVEEEYQKKKDQIYESVIQDVLPQFMSVCMVELNKEFGFGEKRLRSVLDNGRGRDFEPSVFYAGLSYILARKVWY